MAALAISGPCVFRSKKGPPASIRRRRCRNTRAPCPRIRQRALDPRRQPDRGLIGPRGLKHDARLSANRGPTMLKQIALAAALLVFFLAGGAEATRCEDLLKRFGDRLAQPACFESQDLTTRNGLPGQLTTPLDNTQVDKDGNPLPAGAWTPRTDRTVIAPDA